MSGEEKPTISYAGGDVNELLRKGRKIVTLRKPAEKYDVPVGAKFDADCYDAKDVVPGVVIANDKRKLTEYPDYTLMLDGYALPEIAAEDLANWYKGTTPESVMQRIATLPDEIWDKLSEEQQKQLLEVGLDAAMKLPEFRSIFMPALLHWFLTYGNATVNEWHSWLVNQGLVADEEITDKTDVDEETVYFYYDSLFALGGMETILNQFDQDSPEYRNLVLHEPVPVPFE